MTEEVLVSPEARRQYFEAMETLFGQVGWKILLEDIEAWKTAIASGWRGFSVENLRYEQGRYDGLSQVTDMFKQIQMAKASADVEEELAPPEFYNA